MDSGFELYGINSVRVPGLWKLLKNRSESRGRFFLEPAYPGAPDCAPEDVMGEIKPGKGGAYQRPPDERPPDGFEKRGVPQLARFDERRHGEYCNGDDPGPPSGEKKRDHPDPEHLVQHSPQRIPDPVLKRPPVCLGQETGGNEQGQADRQSPLNRRKAGGGNRFQGIT